MAVNENMLEQAIIAELQAKGYEYEYGPDIERDYHEVILEDTFRSSMLKINPGISHAIITEAFKAVRNLGLLRLEDLNASFHKYLIEGVPVPYQRDGESRTFTVKLVDFDVPEKNNFKVVNQYTVIEYKNKRPDVLVFINGIPMVLFELKNMANTDTTEEEAYRQVRNYQLDIPSLFHYNAFNVISDGINNLPVNNNTNANTNTNNILPTGFSFNDVSIGVTNLTAIRVCGVCFIDACE